MTLYIVTWTARPTPYHHERTYRQWAGTMDEARRAAREVAKVVAIGEVVVEQVTVPTDKAGLIAFLNSQYEPRRVEP